MATVTSYSTGYEFWPSGRLWTVADVAALPMDLPSGPVDYELDNGRIVIMVPPGDSHGKVQLRIGSALLVQGALKGFGDAATDVGVILWRDPDRLVGPDVAFVAANRLPIQCSREGYWETIPDLVVEVRSKNDSLKEIGQKVADYLKAGVRIVWVADPEDKTVTEYRAATDPRGFSSNDTLVLPDLLPEFRLALKEVFPN